MTLTVPADSGGLLTMHDVESVQLMTVAVAVPNLTVAPATKPEPVMVAVVEPESGPALGDTDVTDGTGS